MLAYLIVTGTTTAPRATDLVAGLLGMVDEVLETLVHQQPQRFTPGSDRDPGF